MIEVEKILSVLTDLITEGHQTEPVLVNAGKFFDLLVEQNRVPDVLRLADGLTEALGGTADVRARIEFRLGSVLQKHRMPRVVLDRIGEEDQPWERELDPHLKAHLALERSQALSKIGKPHQAVQVGEAALAAISLEADPEMFRALRRQLAVLYRGLGQQERALRIFDDLLVEADRQDKLLILQNKAVSFFGLGRPPDALKCLDQAVLLARGPLGRFNPKIEADRAIALAAMGRKEEAITALLEIAEDCLSDPAVLLSYASAWMTCSGSQRLSTPEARHRTSVLFGRLDEARKSTYERCEMLDHIQFLRAMAMISDAWLPESTNVFWKLVDVGSREFEHAPDPVAIVALACEEYVESKLEDALQRLAELPDALAHWFGGNTDLDLTLRATHQLERPLRKLTRLALTSGLDFTHVRVISEVNRDVLGKIYASTATAYVSEATEQAWALPTDDAVERLLTPGKTVAVLEWLDDGETVKGLLTCVSDSRTVKSRWLQDPEIDLKKLNRKLSARLLAWRRDFKEEPFDFAEWKQFEAWLDEELKADVPDGGHLVILEREDFAGIPWHVAAAERWTTSYAPSWASLFATAIRPARPEIRSLGVAMVPCFGDPTPLLEALQQSTKRGAELATRCGLVLRHTEGESCDHVALRSMLENTDVVKLLCHGYVEQKERVVALILAHNGGLPPGSSAALGTPEGRAHRFTWQDCQDLSATPTVVFSAACQSGVAHIAGLGERLGLFGTLRRRGTKAMVAPRWNIDPGIVLPILDDAMQNYVAGGQNLSTALSAACAQAARHHPRWLAWSLALEGDWR